MERIGMYFHCKNCFFDKPKGLSPKEWMNIEAGFADTEDKLAIIRCVRCNKDIVVLSVCDTTQP